MSFKSVVGIKIKKEILHRKKKKKKEIMTALA